MTWLAVGDVLLGVVTVAALLALLALVWVVRVVLGKPVAWRRIRVGIFVERDDD